MSMNAAADLATKIANTLTAHGIRIIGSSGSRGLLAFRLRAEDLVTAEDLLRIQFGHIDGLTITGEKWDADRVAVYARNVPAEAGASARIRLSF
jgi:hypothetical protein